MARFLALLALVVAVISLALNLLLIQRLDQSRAVVIDTLDQTSKRIDSLADVSFQQTVRVNQSFSVSGQMPINQSMTVPISMTVPVDTSMNVDVNTPLGPMSMPVRVNTNFPVRMQVPIAISQTIPYSITVPIDMQVPFNIKLRDLGIEPAIKDAQDQIRRLRGTLE